MAYPNRKYEVTFETCGTRSHVDSTVVIADSEASALSKAVEKTYGRSAFFFKDSGCEGYGQIFKPNRPNSNVPVTGRIHCDVSTVARR